MEDLKKEIMIEKYPRPVSIKGTKKILNQLENNICKIYKKDGSKGTGFFCIISYNNIIIPVMMTNNNVIDEKYIKENNEIQITLNDDKEEKIIKINDKRKIYTNKEYDTTIIEIKQKEDKINNFMEIDENIYKNSNIIYNNKSIYIIQYPFSDKAHVSYGIINNINEYNIVHYCCTESGSSGSPIINLLNHKIIGIHKEGSSKFQLNKGTYLKYPINDFINKYINNNENIINNEKNEIEIELKIEKDDINKRIYFIDNIDYIEDKSNIKHYHDNLKELNESNVDLYINNKKYKYEKYIEPKKEGIYKIKLILKTYIKDCSFMFGGCKNIININFKYFNTKNVINMRYMFTGCINLEILDLSPFNTKNVIDMEGIFGRYSNLSYLSSSNSTNLPKIKIHYDGCEKLNNLNISSFDTKNVTNMSFMFNGCKKLNTLNLSSFNTEKVTNMSTMFSGCKYLNDLNLSSFDTKNVTNMFCMFGGCENLNNLDLSFFDTKKVINMSAMFCRCEHLINLNLSSFDIKNDTNIKGMFKGCKNISNYNFPSFFIDF